MRHATGMAVIASVAILAAACGSDRPSPAAAPPRPACTPSFQPPPATGPRVMVVGDSISNGSSGDFTWRYRLYEHLREDKVAPEFVGPFNDLFDNVKGRFDCDHSYAEPAFPQAHDATWGRKLAEEKTTIGGEVARYQPAYLLVLLGFNDLSAGAAAARTQQDLTALIAAARAAEPGVRIVLGQITPSQRAMGDAVFAARVADFDNRMAQTARTSSTAASPIVVAPVAAELDPTTDLWDGIHPNAKGEEKIAAAFADTLAADFGIGTRYPRPYPDTPVGPRTAPQLTATPAPGKVTLSWTASPGATGYTVFVDAMKGGGFTPLALPLTAGSSPWTGLFPSGGDYQIRLQAFKGSGVGAFSNTVKVSVPSS